MKRCPECRRDYYDDSQLYCLDDGSALLEGPANRDEPATVSLRTPDPLSGTATTEPETRLYTSGDVIKGELKRHKLGLAAVVGLAAVLVAGFGYGVYRFLDRSEPAKTSTNTQTQRLTGDGITPDAVISPDGKFLAYIKLEGDALSLWMRQLQTNSTIPIVKPGELRGFSGITFSPDGSFIYFNAIIQDSDAPTVYRVPTLGGSPVKVITNAYNVQFSPKGDQVSFLRSDNSFLRSDTAARETETGVFIANTDGSNERKIASRSGNELFVGLPAWSPDGRYIAVGYSNNSLLPKPSRSLKLISVADHTISDLGSFRWTENNLVAIWHPSGDSLIAVSADDSLAGGQLWEVSFPSGAVRRISDRQKSYYSVSITSDGRIVTCESYSRSAIWVSPDLKPENAKQIMPATADTWGISWTPDNRIVFASDQTGNNEIWTIDADGGNARPLTNDGVFKVVPVASPDGRYIVYVSSNEGRRLERIDMGGGNLMVFDKSVYPDNPDISQDGQWIIYDAFADGVQRIFRVPIGGGEPQAMTNEPAIEPRYSNDGTKFACILTGGKTKLGIFGASGVAPLQTFDLPNGTETYRGPVWTPDDRGITVVVAIGGKINLWLVPLDGSASKPITNFDKPVVYRRSFSRDGKRIALVRGEGIGNAVMITGYR